MFLFCFVLFFLFKNLLGFILYILIQMQARASSPVSDVLEFQLQLDNVECTATWKLECIFLVKHFQQK